jgi:phage-related protein
MTYTGTIGVNSELVVDTEKLTATLDGQNALPNYNEVFPKLQPGDNTVVAATEGTTIIKWYDRWI